MTTASAPAWPQPFDDPFSRANIEGAVLRPIAKAKHSPNRGSEIISHELVIGDVNASNWWADQRCPPVQRQLSETEQDVLETLDEFGPILTARRIAELLDCESVESLRNRELHTLQRDRLIVSVPRRGYRRAE